MKPKNHAVPTNTCRSLVCDSNGIIVAESVFRCMLCSTIFDSIQESKNHYYQFHVDDDDDDDLREAKELVNQSRSANGSSLSQAHPTVVKALSYPTPDARSKGSWVNSPNPVPERVIDEADGNTEVAVGKAGHVKCAVCGVVRFYSCVYRRYGHFTCQVCYRFFRTFFTKPKRYFCQNLGSCKLDVRVRCRACWLLSCINLYAVDENRRATIDEYYPRESDDTAHEELKPSNFAVSLPQELSPLSQSPPPSNQSSPKVVHTSGQQDASEINLEPLAIDFSPAPPAKKQKTSAKKLLSSKSLKTSFKPEDFDVD